MQPTMFVYYAFVFSVRNVRFYVSFEKPHLLVVILQVFTLRSQYQLITNEVHALVDVVITNLVQAYLVL